MWNHTKELVDLDFVMPMNEQKSYNHDSGVPGGIPQIIRFVLGNIQMLLYA